MALYFQKNTLLQTVFLAILPTGWFFYTTLTVIPIFVFIFMFVMTRVNRHNMSKGKKNRRMDRALMAMLERINFNVQWL